MSASPSKADILKVDSDVRLVPEADFSSSYFISGDDGSSSLLVSAADRAAAPSAAAARARSASWVLNPEMAQLRKLADEIFGRRFGF
jgi:hypothetical protein